MSISAKEIIAAAVLDDARAMGALAGGLHIEQRLATAILAALDAAGIIVAQLNETGGARLVDGDKLGCRDCGEPYGSPRFPDLIIDDDAFAAIAPNPPDGGLLCPNCICARLEKAGLSGVSARFTSGPLGDQRRTQSSTADRSESERDGQ